MGNMDRGYVYWVIMAMALLSICGPAKGQVSSVNTSCINSLIQCGNYLATTGTPPSSCCNPLKNVINTEMECLCNLLNDTTLLHQFQINITQVEQLPLRCGLNATATSCPNVNGNATAPSGSPPPPAGSPPPPSSAGNRNTAASSFLFGTLLLLALLLFEVIAQFQNISSSIWMECSSFCLFEY